MGTIYTRFVHKADIYTKTITINAAGQRKPTWAFSSTTKLNLLPVFSTDRTAPTYEEKDEFKMEIPNVAPIDYSIRIYNIRDRFGNVIEAGPLEIHTIEKHIGFKGKVHHFLVDARRVIE